MLKNTPFQTEFNLSQYREEKRYHPISQPVDTRLATPVGPSPQVLSEDLIQRLSQAINQPESSVKAIKLLKLKFRILGIRFKDGTKYPYTQVKQEANHQNKLNRGIDNSTKTQVYLSKPAGIPPPKHEGGGMDRLS